MKALRILLLVLIVVVVMAPTAGLYWLASTEAGLRFIASHLGQRGPVNITATDVTGTLAGGFTASFVRVQERHVDVQVTGVAARLRLLPLLVQRRIEIERLEATQVRVQLFRVPPRKGGSSSGTLRFMPPTLGVKADELRAGTVDLLLASGRTLHATNASGGAEVLPQVIRLHDAQLDWQDMHLAADGRVHATDDLGLDGRIAAHWTPEDKPAWRFEVGFDGDLEKLPLKLDIAAPFHAHVDGVATTLTSSWKLAGNGTTSDLDISVFGAGDALGIISAQVAITVDGDGFSAKGPVTAPGLKAGPLEVDFHGAYSDKRLTIRETALLHKPSGSRATVRGTVDFIDGGPRIAIGGRWTTLQWPLMATKPAFTSAQGQYTLEGNKPWQVTAQGEISAAGLAGAPASARGTLGTDSFTIDQATLGLFGGSATVTGEARWRPAESWNIGGHMSGLDPALFREDMPGRLDFDFRAAGAPFGDAGSIDFAVSKLAGKLRGQAASGGGRFTKEGGSADWRFHDVDLHVGRTRVQLDGSLAHPRDLRFAVDADDLSLLDASARGRISARGRYAGTEEAPLLLLKARGTEFQWQDYRIDAVDADVDLDLQDEGHARGKVDLQGAHFGAYTVQQAALQVAGTGKSQRVSMDITAKPLRTMITADGSIDGKVWRGSVASFTAEDDAELRLHLEKPAPVALGMERIEIGDICLGGTPAHGCISGLREADGRWSAALTAQDMPLRAFLAGLSGDISYEGTINVRGAVAGSKGALPTGTLDGELRDARLLHAVGTGIESLSLGSGTIQAAATATGFSAQLALQAGSSSSISGRVTGERNGADWRDHPIRGRLEAHTDALSLLDVYVGDIDKASGQINTTLDVSGTVGTPVLAGQLQLRDASIDIYQSNTALRDVTMDARFDANGLELTGQSRLGQATAQGDGLAHFSGKLAWRDAEPTGTLHVEGKRLRLINLPDARLDASPDLDFKLSKGRTIDITGKVVIPRASFESADLTTAVLKSDDERIVGEVEPGPEQRWKITSSIELELGNDVRISSLGLEAELGGSLLVRTDPSSNNTLGRGKLTITKGKYQAYGRKLDIARGELIFNNGPINNPALNLSAQRELTDIIVGMNVRGPLRNPSTPTFYSDPEGLPQSQIVTLLIAGGTLESLQNSERPGAARTELLAQAVAIGSQGIGARVGIDDVGIESNMNNDTSFVLGKQLSTRLYISYGISLAEAINTFKARFSLGKGWTLKTESGKARSADLVYTFKKGSAKDKAKARQDASPDKPATKPKPSSPK